MPQQPPSYEDVQRSLRQREQQSKITAASQTAPLDPDRAAKIYFVQGKTRLPSDVVDADLDNLYEKVQRDSFDYNNYTDQVNGAPIFNKWAASDPYHPAVLERDRRNLTYIERQFDAIWRGGRKGDAMMELSKISNRRRDGDKREGDEEVLNDLRQLVGAGDFSVDGHIAKLLLFGTEQSKIQLGILQDSMGLAVAGAAEGALAGGLVGAWLGPGSGITALGGAATGFGVGWRVGAFEAGRKLEQGLAYDEYVQLGASEADAKEISGYVGVANGALEMIGINALTKFIPGSKKLQGKAGQYLVERMFQKPTMAGARRMLIARYGEGLATEVLTEVVQESISMWGGEILKDRAAADGTLAPGVQKMTGEDWVDALTDIAVQTVYGTALIGGIGPGASYIGDARRAQRAQATGAYLKGIGEATADLELAKDERLIPKVKEFFQRQSQEGPIKEVRFDLDAWTSYWEGQDQDVEMVSKALGIDLSTVEAQGGDVVIDLENFGEKLAHTDHFTKELWKDAKVKIDDMTYREAKDFMANPEEHVARLKEDLKETFGVETSDDFDRITEDITGQLMQAGKFDQKAAEQQARLMAAVFTTQSLRNQNLNMAPWELYVSRVLGIKPDVRDTAARPGTVDLRLDPLLDRIRTGDIPTQRQIFGDSLVDFVVKNGKLNDEGGELAARDYKKLRRGLVSPDGLSLDGMAELAHEQGYIAARDPQLLLDMMDRELQQDEPVFNIRQQNTEMQTLADDLNEMAAYLESEGIDIDTMTNEEIRKAIDNRQVFEQTDKSTLEELGELIVATIGNPSVGESYARDLLKIEGMIPRVAEDQDFGDMEFTDRVRIKGRDGTRTRKAQKVFDTEVKKRNALKTLMDCMGGKR